MLLILGGAAHNGLAQQSAVQEAKVATQIDGYEVQFPALGTLVNFKAFHEDVVVVERAFEKAQAEVIRLGQILTDYDPESETRKLTLLAQSQPVRVSRELWDVLLASDRWNVRTQGAFDSSLGALTQLWRKYRRVHKEPDTSEIQRVLEDCGWANVQLHRSAQSVQFSRPGLRLDFGAIGKGYIVDHAFRVLNENGIDCCLVNISGNMRCGTPPPGRVGWNVEVAPLEKDGEAIRRIRIRECAIATSGDLWQFSIVAGRRRSHVLDPETGLGVLGPVSATVIASSATDADAFATAACILPIERTQALADQYSMALLRAEVRGEKLQLVVTPGFPEAIEIDD